MYCSLYICAQVLSKGPTHVECRHRASKQGFLAYKAAYYGVLYHVRFIFLPDFQSKSNSSPKKKKATVQSKLPFSPPKAKPSPKKEADIDGK